MTPERWKKIRDVFDQLSDLPAKERDARLAQTGAQDPELEREVRSLLQASTAAGDFLETPPVGQIRRALSQHDPGRRSRIGPYEVVRELGYGGMGTVYLATRGDAQFRQTVALKLVRRGMDTDFILDRFRGERQILAALNHPNIARLLDGGSTEDGQPYFVMEYIPGVHLLQDCDARGLSTRQRLVLFQQVCAAVAYAHQQLVVHRDVKPSNILVTPEGVPKLLDFGLARLLEPEPAAAAGERTETALRFLTPEYASPEQVRGERISTASDIYSLGVVLYELLTGHRPYRLSGRRPDEVARAVCEEEPDRPSTAVGRLETMTSRDGTPQTLTPDTVSATRGGDPKRLRRALRGDLDNIVLTALRKEPERRYASVEQLADDVRRHLEGRPIKARKDTVSYRAGKFLSRHRVGVGLAAAVTATVFAAAVMTIRSARVAQVQHREAERHFNEVRELANSFLFEFHDAIKDLPGATPARQLVVRRALEYLQKLSAGKTDDPTLRLELAEAYERIARVQGGLFESHLGDTEGALKSLLKALAIREEFARKDPADPRLAASLAETQLQLSEVLVVSQDIDAAVSQARRAVAILEGLAAKAPGDPALRFRLARARRYLGAALSDGPDRAGALAALRSAAAAFQALCGADGPASSSCHELALAHQLVVHALSGTKDRDTAMASYEKAVALLEESVRARPASFTLRRELAYCHMSMGTFLEWSGDVEGALTYYSRTVPILEELAAADSRNADVRLLLAEAYNSVGFALSLRGETAAALQDLERSNRLFEAVASEDPVNTRARLGLARLADSFGTAYEVEASRGADAPRRQHLKASLDWYRKSLRLYLDLQTRGRLTPQAELELAAEEKKVAAAEKRLAASADPGSAGDAAASQAARTSS